MAKNQTITRQEPVIAIEGQRVSQITLDQWKRQLTEWLELLKNGQIVMVEFGKKHEITTPGVADVFTRIRIRRAVATFTIAFVHVFYGEQDTSREYRIKEPTHYPLDDIDGLVSVAMKECHEWAEARARIGANFVNDLNEGLNWTGYEVDRSTAAAGI